MKKNKEVVVVHDPDINAGVALRMGSVV